jgi:hypothetical protein
MRVVESNFEYSIKCQCGLRLAFSILEYSNNIGKVFPCPHCNTQIQLIDAEILTWKTTTIKDGELIFKQLTYEG